MMPDWFGQVGGNPSSAGGFGIYPVSQWIQQDQSNGRQLWIGFDHLRQVEAIHAGHKHVHYCYITRFSSCGAFPKQSEGFVPIFCLNAVHAPMIRIIVEQPSIRSVIINEADSNSLKLVSCHRIGRGVRWLNAKTRGEPEGAAMAQFAVDANGSSHEFCQLF